VFDYLKYIRQWNFPHIWCSGCGDGIVLKALLRSMEKLEIKQDEAVMVSGIGCSSRTPGYVDINTLHTTHGRALAFATGVKMAKPSLKVIVVTGDGDATAIGGNHFIHAARRNIDITVLLYNNYIYGMTGGQCSPTTPIGSRASTAQFGNIESPFNISGLAIAAGASFVARGDVYSVKKLESLISKALDKKGFSLVEVITPCPTAFGRRNRMASPVKLMEDLRDNTVSVQKWEKMSEEEKKGKIRTGVLVDREQKEYTDEYAKLIERIGSKE
jgi:2-oxoglutarate ferredoxin oxidoreductase subunit beta